MIFIFFFIYSIQSLQFNEWKSKYNKHYSSSELLRRRAIYNSNLKLISEIKETLPYKISIDTPFADMTEKEFNALFPNQDKPQITKTLKETLEVKPQSHQTRKRDEVLGSTLDYRNYNGGLNYVVSPSDQGTSCVCSYAFSTVSIIESKFLLSNSNYNPNNFALSPQDIIACSTSYQPSGSGGCNGGSVSSSLKYSKEIGISLLSDYPYTGYATACENKNKFVKVENYDVVETEGDYTKLKQLIVEKGPVVVHIDTTKSFLRFYTEGIFESRICSETTQNHAVTVVGYGVSGNKEYFVCKNSWGTGWGEEGYFRIRADKYNCGITAYATYVDSVTKI